MNEILLLLQLSIIFIFTLLSVRLGKEALFSWISLQAILANFFVLKQITLFGWHVTCSDAYAIGTLISLNLLQAYYGKESAKKAIWISFASMLFFAALSKVHLLFQTSALDETQNAYSLLLSPAPRLLGASLATFLIVQHLDLHLFRRMGGTLSIIFSQICDTALFTLLGLYGLVDNLGEIFGVSVLLKLTIILLLTPLMPLARKVVRHAV